MSHDYVAFIEAIFAKAELEDVFWHMPCLLLCVFDFVAKPALSVELACSLDCLDCLDDEQRRLRSRQLDSCTHVFLLCSCCPGDKPRRFMIGRLVPLTSTQRSLSSMLILTHALHVVTDFFIFAGFNQLA